MELDLIKALYDFTQWANVIVLEQAKLLGEDDYARVLSSAWGSVRGTLTHIYAGDLIWLRRWQGTSPPSLPGEDAFPSLAALRAEWESLVAERHNFLDGLSAADLSHVLEYRTTGGTPHAEPLWQLLVHVVNHSTDHRSQVATLLTELGHPPPGLDMVRYFRL